MIRALTSASNIDRRQKCPGSAFAESLFSEPEDSADSKEGTLLHGHSADSDKDRADLTSEQREILEKAARTDKQIFSALHTSCNMPEDEPFDEGNEREMWFFRGLKKLFPGHCDYWRFYPRTKILVIIDRKFGRKEVTPAEANMQLRCYAVMGAKLWNPEKVLVAINQPRLGFEACVTLAEYTSEQIPAARDHILRVWDGSHNADASPRAEAVRESEAQEQCRYCRARLHCDAYRAKYEWLAGPSQTGKDAFVAKLSTLTDDGLDAVWRAVVFAKLIEKEAKAEIIARQPAGGMPMYELSDTGNTSTINDTPRAMRLLQNAGLSEGEIMDCAKLTKEKLAEKIQVRESLTMVAAKKRLNAILEPVLTITAKSPSLKRIPTSARVPLPPAEKPADARVLDNGTDDQLFPR